MIDTVMVLWNRSLRSRGRLAAFAFFLICISTSLLLIMVIGVGSHRSALPRATRNSSVPGNQTPVVSVPSLIIPTQSNQAKKHQQPRHKATPVVSPHATPLATATADTCDAAPTMSNVARAELKPRDGRPGGCCTNCLNNSVGVGDASLLSSLGSYLWLIMGVSSLGTLLFYGAMYIVCRRRSAQWRRTS
jgi:hypothetical protein